MSTTVILLAIVLMIGFICCAMISIVGTQAEIQAKQTELRECIDFLIVAENRRYMNQGPPAKRPKVSISATS